MNVKSTPFGDPNDTFFEREVNSLKELMSKTGTLDNPYLYCPSPLMDLCLLHHPPGEFESKRNNFNCTSSGMLTEVDLFMVAPQPQSQSVAKSIDSGAIAQSKSAKSTKSISKKSESKSYPDAKKKSKTQSPKLNTSIVTAEEIPAVSGRNIIRINCKEQK
jgi:hypothetical protein